MPDAPILVWILLGAGGFIAGSLGGLLGIGGGIVLIPLLRFGLGLSPAMAAGTSIMAIFFTTLGGSYRHIKQGHLQIRSVIPVIAAGIFSTVIFSYAFSWLALRGNLLDAGMGLVFLLIAGRMLWEGVHPPRNGKPDSSGSRTVPGSISQKGAIGLAGGALPGLLGIGTGGILVPAFVFWLRTPVRVAVAASLTCFCCNACVSATFKAAQGYINWTIAPPLAAGTFFGAMFGAILNRRFSPHRIKLLFGLLFTIVALKLILF
jgi:uncharacterized protein